ncbi:pyridoxal phosphate-dependent aminotransferase [Halobaculum sp. CBA1158]|uniref:pyridoxal phosphate-dependent aminotransferase n=1 Tax=Halobaculum sp. CBA1158 TaxID=2904243 RepID=UPI001F3ECF3E|nr:pyridoxal phosphate-dependent aminotransferase [Halobaculum sp. CBA1158]UIO99338.1 pyridoxal phosphate-dependent aminotransferase [Halobaculum sp. CBA1158]
MSGREAAGEFAYDFAERVGRVEPSATLAISNAANELEAEGHDVVDLSVGAPDFPTPETVVEAGKDALDAGHTGYTSSNGVPELKEAIAEKLRADDIDADADDVIVTPGAKQALYETVQTLVDDGDEVVLLDPAWVSYEAMVKLAGGDLARVDLAPHNFSLADGLDDLAATVSDDTELLIVNSPSNPTGAVYADEGLEGVRDLAVEHDVAVISDEIYDEIVYGVEQTSLASLDGMADRTVTINGFSKAYSMTGWRLGYLHATGDLIPQAGKLHSHSVSCATNFVQRAGIEALRNTDESVEEMRAAFESRRDMLVDLFDDHGVDVTVPDGAFYMMLPVDEDDSAWAEEAIQEAHVATVPGSAFGAPGYARISYAASEDRLKEGMQRLFDAGLLGDE